MAFYDKKRTKENELNTPSICCFSFPCLFITRQQRRNYASYEILNLLEKNDFVKRKEHSRDTRAKAVILNKKGEETLQKAVPLVEQIDEIFFEKLDTDEEQFKHFLARLNEE